MQMRKTGALIFLIGFMLIVYGSPAFGQELPVSMQAKLMLKIAAMDRNTGRYGDPVKIGVTTDEMLLELNALSETRINGRSFDAEKMNSTDDVEGFKLLYIGANWKDDYQEVSSMAERNQNLIFAAEEEYCVRMGAGVAFKMVDGKPKIVVNLDAVKKQGADFPANFLKVTVVVGGLN